DRVRTKALKDFEDTVNDPQKLGRALSESIANGDWRLFFLQRDRWKTLRAEDVQQAAIAYLKPTNVTIGYYIPDATPERAPPPPTVDIAALVKNYKGEPPVAAGETFDPSPANLEARTERFALPNGVKVAFLPKKTRGETVRMQLALHFGDLQSVSGRKPQGSLTGAMLMRGTQKHNRQEIEDLLDRLRAKLAVGGSETGASASVQTVREHLADTVRLAAEVLREPAFPPAELEEIRRARLTALEQARADPQAIASRTLQRQNNPYPPGDPRYAPTFDEEIAALKAVKIDDLQRFYSQFYGPAKGEIAIVGDFDPAAMRTLLTELFGSWKPAAPFTRVPNPFIPNKAAAIQVETPDKANAVLLGGLSLPVNDQSADYPTLLLMSFMLGDSSNSRLLNRLRQKEGVSYSAGQYLSVSSFELNSTLGVYAIFAPQNLARVRKGIEEELALAVKDGFTEAEVEEAKRGLMQERRLQRAQDGAIAGALTSQLYLGRNFGRTAEVDAAIQAATAEQVNAVARKYLKPDELATVFAGDFAKVK
ncbi:MAG: pitrilysin family protein, partial [Casimicrobiaceae bacterium]